jgi:hypothetical protein
MSEINKKPWAVDIKWLRQMSDENFENWVNNTLKSRAFAEAIVIDLRDSILQVLVKHDICPVHWKSDECPIEIYGKKTKIGSKYESELSHLMKVNADLRKRLEKK